MPVTHIAAVKHLYIVFFATYLSACAPPAEEISLQFAAAFHGQPIGCNAGQAATHMTDLRFYVHDVAVMTDDGSVLDVDLAADGAWQDDSVALVDLETGEGACLNGSGETHSTVRGSYRGGRITGLTFRVGVPEDLNHRDPLTAAPPLGYSVMHWHWASGYKFMRAGIERDDDSVFLHLGSSRCEGTIGDIRGCGSANRPLVVLDDFEPDRDQVVFDLGLLFRATDLDDGKRSECMSGPANQQCADPFRQLGISMETGQSVGTAAAFKARRKR
jgi:uncharacterized repeat protein (TIGR04052 family)